MKFAAVGAVPTAAVAALSPAGITQQKRQPNTEMLGLALLLLQEDDELEAEMGVITEDMTPRHPLEQALMLLEKHDAATAAKFIEEHTGSSSGGNTAQAQQQQQQQQSAGGQQLDAELSLQLGLGQQDSEQQQQGQTQQQAQQQEVTRDI